MRLPPKGIAPARLFRQLLQTPRASVPVRLSFAGIERGAFRIQAVTARELRTALDFVAVDAPAEVRERVIGVALVQSALCDASGTRVFESTDDVGELDADEAELLTMQIRAVLAHISPTFITSDVAAWRETLREGARENMRDAIALGSSLEDLGHHYADRPDRFFGLPLGAITDGQWLAFFAARDLYLQSIRA